MENKQHLKYFAPDGWVITCNAKPIVSSAHDFEFVHENYDGENGLCGTAGSHIEAVLAIIDMLDRDDSFNNSPAPDLCVLNVVLTADNNLMIDEAIYTGNTFSVSSGISPFICLGDVSGSCNNYSVYHQTGHYINIEFLNCKEPAVGAKQNNSLIVPGAEISCGGICTLDIKDKYIEYCKKAIRQSLVDSVEVAKKGIVATMQNDVSLQQIENYSPSYP